MFNYPYGGSQQINLNWIISEILALHQRLDPDYTAPTFTQIYPFSDTQQLNLDWILTELKVLKELAPEEDERLLKMVANALLAATYDETMHYNTNDIVYRDEERRLYKCVVMTPHNGEPWNPDHWEEIKLNEDVTKAIRGIRQISEIIDLYNPNASYRIANHNGAPRTGYTIAADGTITVSQDYSNYGSAYLYNDSLLMKAGTYRIKAHVSTSNQAPIRPNALWVRVGLSSVRGENPVLTTTESGETPISAGDNNGWFDITFITEQDEAFCFLIMPLYDDWKPLIIDNLTIEGITAYDGIARRAIKNQNLTICRKGRFLDAPYLTGNQQVLYGQSCCYYDNKYYIVGSYNNNANQTITVWDSTGQLLNSAEYTTLDHCNGICATDEYILVAAGTTNNIYVINRTTLAYVKSISNISGIDNVTGISNDNEIIYFCGYTTSGGGKRTIFTLNLENESYTEIAVFPKPTAGSPQNFCVHDGYAYFLYVQGNNIFKFNLARQTTEIIYNIPDGDGWYPCGECESLFYKDNNIYLFTALYYRDSFVRTNPAAICEIFETDILKPIQNTNASSYMLPQSSVELLVKKTMTYTFNPTTTFSTVEEACHILNYLKYGMIVPDGDTAGGAAKLTGGIFSLRASGGAYIDDLHVINAFLEISQIGVKTKTYVQNCYYRGSAGWFAGNIETWRSTVELNRFDMSGITAFNLNRTRLFINYFTAALAGTATLSGTQNISNMVEIKDTYKQYCLKPLQLTASPSNSNAIITVATSTLVASVLLTLAELAAGKTVTIGNDTIAFTNDFKIKINDTELSATDIITATAIRRG